MVSGIREVFIDNLRHINWMDEETKALALKKVENVLQYIDISNPSYLICFWKCVCL